MMFHNSGGNFEFPELKMGRSGKLITCRVMPVILLAACDTGS